MSFWIVIAILTLLNGCHCISCPKGLDGFPANSPLGKCLSIGCETPIENQQCWGRCLAGYDRSPQGFCFVRNCLQKQQTMCQKCSLGYEVYITESNNQTLCRPLNCKNYTQSTSTCIQCSDGYTLNQTSNKCTPNKCAKFYQQLNLCYACEDGYSLIQSQTSIRCLPNNCEKFNETTMLCQQCQQNYTLSNSTCVNTASLCTRYNNLTKLCEQCIEGFRLIGYKTCLGELPNCQDYGFDGCTRCSVGYIIINNNCFARDCLQYYSNSSCSTCQKGFKLTNGLCTPDTCLDFDMKLWQCQKCYTRFEMSFVQSDIDRYALKAVCNTKNCSFVDSSTNRCLLCDQDYVLVDGYCLLANCVDNRADKCDRCTEGWLKNSDGNCIIKDCLTFDSKFKCNGCRPGLRLFRDICISDNCLLRDQSTGNCQQCHYNYTRSPDGKLCVPYFCQKYDNATGECLQCIPNFKINSQYLCQSSLCLGFETKKNFVHPQCTKCPQGYEPEDRYCVVSKKYCPKYQLDTNQCLECPVGYQFRTYKASTPSILSINNNTDGVCVLKKCLNYKVYEKLDFYFARTQCLTCSLGYALVADSSENGQFCKLLNCSSSKWENYTDGEAKNSSSLTLRGVESCEKCADKYTLLFDICVADNCQQYGDNGLCTSCLPGFFFNVSTLTCHRYNCLNDTKSACLQCSKGLRIIQNPSQTSQTFQTVGLCMVINCNKVSFPDISTKSNPNPKAEITCTECKSGYVYSQIYKMCIAKYCQTLNQTTGSCVGMICRLGYQMNALGLCEVISNYGFCPIGKYADTLRTYTCISPEAKNCTVANPTKTSQCYVCSENYLLNETLNECISIINCQQVEEYVGCTVCKPGYSLNSRGQCQDTIANCQQYGSLGKDLAGRDIISCQQCITGYQIVIYPTRFCQVVPKYCSILNPSGTCSQCRYRDRTLQNNGSCFLMTQNCLTYEVENGTCTSCEQGFLLDLSLSKDGNPHCYQNPLHCLQARTITYCLKCQAPYLLKDGLCVSEIPNCSQYSGNVCLACQDSFYRNSAANKCIPYPKNCKQVIQDGAGSCKLCIAGYTIYEKVCVRQIDLCVKYSTSGTNICLQCQQGYTPSTNGMFCLLGF